MSVPLDQPVRLTFSTFSDAAQTTPADPTTVSIDVLDPTGATLTYTWAGGDITRDSLGVFHIDITPSLAGHYAFHWKATGAVATSLDGAFDVDAEFRYGLVSTDDFKLYLNNPGLDTNRARFILDKAQQLCETVVKPLPVGSDVVILDVAERAFANPTNVGGSDLGLYSEGVGPYSTTTPGTVGGGLYLTANNVRTLRRLNGTSGGAFTIDTTPAGAGSSLPWWDTGAVLAAGDWDSPT